MLGQNTLYRTHRTSNSLKRRKEIHLAPAAAQDELFSCLQERFLAHTTHMQSVTRLPYGAEVLAWNPFEAHHGVRFAPRVWGVQFHPEFTSTPRDGHPLFTSYIRAALVSQNKRKGA